MNNAGKPLKITLVGAGNVAWHLGHALVKNGMEIHQVISRTLTSARLLARELDAVASDNFSRLAQGTDFCIVCVSDDAIPQVLKALDPGDCIVTHTSGSTAMSVMSDNARRYGVLYPLQTFTRGKPVEFEKVPLLVEGNSPEVRDMISYLAGTITRRVIHADSNQRLYLHLAAVFASNFSNHMYALAEKLSLEHGLSFELLKPLIEETTAKATGVSPVKAQTGPAVRRNSVVIEKHLSLLKEHPDWQLLYRLISESIKNLPAENGSVPDDR